MEDGAIPDFEMRLNVLGYKEKSMWVALALEMDLRGRGKTFEIALADLRDLVAMQISFALFKRQPTMILRPAEPIWFDRFASLRAEMLMTLHTPRLADEAEYAVGSIPLPPPDVISQRQSQFSLANA